jgi:hypothetical protein
MSPENYPLCVASGTFAVRNQGSRRIREVVPGDRIAVYLSGEKVIAGLFRATSGYMHDGTPLWPDGVYPHRIRVEPISLLPEEARVPLDRFKNRLEVGRPYPNFGLVTQKAVYPLPESDYAILAALVEAEQPLGEAPAPRPVEPGLTPAARERPSTQLRFDAPRVELPAEPLRPAAEAMPRQEESPSPSLRQELHRARQRNGLLERKIAQLEELLALAGPNLEDYLRLAHSSQGLAFEEATRKCFVALGFVLDPDFQGQPGEIDFVATAPYLVFGECQASGSQNVGVGIVDKLLRHRRRYLHQKELFGAQPGPRVVVCENTTEQLVQDATTEGVAVLRASSLAALVKLKREYPGAVHPYNLRPLLETAGDISTTVIRFVDQVRDEIEKRVGVIEVLKNDRFARAAGVTGRDPGWIQARLEAELETHLSLGVVEEILRELTSPLVGCVGVEAASGGRARYFYIRDYDFQIASVEPRGSAAPLPG